MKATVRTPVLAFLVLASLVACAGDEPEDASQTAAATAAGEAEVAESTAVAEARASVPLEGFRTVDRELLERERLEDSWRRAAEADRTRLRPTTSRGTVGASGDETPIERLRRGSVGTGTPAAASGGEGEASQPTEAPQSESWEDLSQVGVFERPPVLPVPQSGGGPTILRVQQMLDRVGFSPGVIDGRWGKNTEKAVYWLQVALGEEPDGEVDGELFDRLSSEAGGSAVRTYQVTDRDLDGPFEPIPEEPTAMAELDCLCYESAREALAERFHTTTELLAQLNPDVDLEALTAGTELRVPNVETPAEGRNPSPRFERVVISNPGKYLHVLDEQGNLLRHYPTTVGSGYDSSPEGELEVQSISLAPDFHYQPKLFHDVPDEEEDALLPAGPNSPVGEVWIQLSKENYGIHGTAEPETIGYTSSHGCVRLTNWDAIGLANQVPQGTTVEFLGAGESGAETATDR